MSGKQLFKFSRTKSLLIGLVLLSILEGIVIIRLSKENRNCKEFRKWCWSRYEKSTRLHQYRIKIFNYDRDLQDVVLRYRTFSYKVIPIGNLPALNSAVTDPQEIKANKNAHMVIVNIEDMASPMFFEIIGKREDGSVFEGRIPPEWDIESYIGGFDIDDEQTPFEVYIYKDRQGLNYH